MFMLKDSAHIKIYCGQHSSTRSLTRIFIEQSNKKKEEIHSSFADSQDDGCKRKSQQQVFFKQQHILQLLVAIYCLVALCLLSGKVTCQLSGEIKSNLPTVIVRGFLNYRTTVDGTVLLFTPDAGSANSGSQTIQASSSAPVLVQTSANFRSTASPQQVAAPIATSQQVEPTSVQSQVRQVSSTFYIGGSSIIGGTGETGFEPVLPSSSLSTNPTYQTTRSSQARSEAAAADDEWRPVQATPALSLNIQSSIVDTIPTGFVAESSTGTSSEQLKQHVDSQQQLVASNDNSKPASMPSVQADDVVVSAAPNRVDPSAQAVSIGVGAGTGRSASARPKRPSLGFNGQGTRPKPGALHSRPQTSNQVEAQASNTINGIRRPGYASTVAPPDSSEAASAPSAFQQRLSSGAAKLRNRFKKPVSNSSHLSTSSAAAQVKPMGLVNVVNESSAGEEAAASLSSSEILVPSVQGISPEQRAPSVQARMGDLFNSGEASNLAGSAAVVGSDDILAGAGNGGLGGRQEPPPTTGAAASGASGTDVSLDLLASFPPSNLEGPVSAVARSGEQRPPGNQQDDNKQAEVSDASNKKLLSGGLTGSLEQPLTFDSFFQSDQAATPSQQTEASDHHASHHERDQPSPQTHKSSKSNHNDKLNSWLGQHHNKFVPRQPLSAHQHDLSQQLASQLPHSLAPSFSSNIPASSMQVSGKGALEGSSLASSSAALATAQLDTLKPSVGSLDELAASNKSVVSAGLNQSEPLLQMQTITKTYSTIMTSLKTRLVPLQVKSSTAIYTITEQYVITKLLTAYQTMPLLGEFILPEPLSTRAPFEMFNEQLSNNELATDNKSAREQPIVAPAAVGGQVSAVADQSGQQEQPISLDSSPKSANDWLHDFSNLSPSSNDRSSQPQQQQQQQQQNNLAALLEQQAQEANLAGLSSLGEPLDQLASSLDPAADGTINIPDLNNPLVLAAAIQNPQLAAVILAAQQLQLKQRANKLNAAIGHNNNNFNNINQQQNAGQQQQQQLLQPSYSTSLSTTIKPSTYTVRDTMYTTRLVSFKDGRTVRTRTVSEPGSVVEQVLTTMATEVTPVTITIRPTGMLTLPSSLATAQAGGSQQSNQATLNNALFATQLAGLLARRQQQVQPSNLGANLGPNGGQINQLAALQQLISQQQQQQQAKQFQPNFQQLMQSMQQQQQQQQQQQHQQQQQQQQQQQLNNLKQAPADNKADKKMSDFQSAVASATQNLAATPVLNAAPLQPITTTLTNLQVRTYTVHNAFKTIYRTITSTQLITSTIFPGAVGLNRATPNTQLASFG